ncbi:hypothetical protein Tco_0833073 [Tanacetum coccineum]
MQESTCTSNLLAPVDQYSCTLSITRETQGGCVFSDIVKFAIRYMKRAILKKAKFDISELNTIKSAKSSFVLVLFGHAVDDDLLHPHHSDRIYEAYMGDKNIIKFEGDHNSPHIHGVGYEDDFLITPQASSNIDDAINQLRLKRPMSKTEVLSDITSKNKQCNSEDEGTTTDPTPSSSTMINFEFPNGHSYVPSPSNDQDYVEYPLQHVEGFPCNAQEEERMLMEAVLLSLKDLEPKQPKEEEQPVSDSKSPVTNHIAPIKTDTTTRDSTASSSESPYGVKMNFNPFKYCAHYGMTCPRLNAENLSLGGFDSFMRLTQGYNCGIVCKIKLYHCYVSFSRSLQSPRSKQTELVVDQRDVVVLTLKNFQLGLEDSVQHNSSIIQCSGIFLGAGMTFTFDVFIQIA